MRLFGREPAQWFQLASGVLIFLLPFFDLRPDINGAVTAVITAAFGLATAATVSAEKAAAAVAALFKALIALALAFRLQIPVDVQTGVMTFVELLTAWYLRTQVVAPVAPEVPDPAPVVVRSSV